MYWWWCRCQDDPNGSPSRELEETTRASLYHVVEHRPVRSESLQPHTEWSSRPRSEPSSVEADVYVWCYALLVVHARKEDDISAAVCYDCVSRGPQVQRLSVPQRLCILYRTLRCYINTILLLILLLLLLLLLLLILLLLLYCVTRTTYVDVVYCYWQSSVVSVLAKRLPGKSISEMTVYFVLIGM